MVLGLTLTGGVWAAGQQEVSTLDDLYRQPVFPTMTQQAEPLTNEQSSLEMLQDITVEDLLNSRKMRWQVGAGGGWNYNSNIFSTPTAVSDQILMQFCNAELDYGDAGAPLNFAGHYQITSREYQKFTKFSGLGYAGGFDTIWLPGEKTRMTGTVKYASGRGSSIGSGAELDRSNLNSTMGIRYQTSEKVSSGCDLGYSSQTYGANQSYVDQHVNLVSDYTVSPKTQIGLGVGTGNRSITGSADETNQSAQLRFSYLITSKMSLRGDFGIENSATSMVSGDWRPRFQCGWQYHPLEETSISFSGYKHTDAYASGTTLSMGQITGVNGTFSQDLFHRVSLNISGGMESIQTESVNRSHSGTSEDLGFFGASLSCPIMRHMGASVFWRSSSSRGNREFEQMNYGIQLSAFY